MACLLGSLGFGDVAALSKSKIPQTEPVNTSSANIAEVTAENLQDTLEVYRNTQVAPALRQLNDLMRLDITNKISSLQTSGLVSKVSMQAVEAELHKRTVIIHRVPPFSNKRSIDDNLYYLLYDSELTTDDIQSVSNHLLTTSSGFLKITFLREQQSKLFFTSFRSKKRYFRTKDPNNYTPDSPVKIERDLSVLERLERQPVLALLDCYTKGATESQTSPLYTDYMRSDFNALQIWSPDGEDLVSQVLYIPQGSTYVCQLAIQPHHREHVTQLFPKYFQERMLQTLRFLQAYVSASRHNATTVRFHYSQTQDVSNVTPSQAVPFFPDDICPLDLDPSLLQTLRAPSNHPRKGGKSKGRGKGNEGKTQGKWFSQEGKGKHHSTSQGSGKGYGSSQSSWRQSQETPSPWAKSKPKETTWSSKGDRARPAPNRRLDNSDPALSPCAACVALLGTNSDYMDCQNSDNLSALRSITLFQDNALDVLPTRPGSAGTMVLHKVQT